MLLRGTRSDCGHASQTDWSRTAQTPWKSDRVHNVDAVDAVRVEHKDSRLQCTRSSPCSAAGASLSHTEAPRQHLRKCCRILAGLLAASLKPQPTALHIRGRQPGPGTAVCRAPPGVQSVATAPASAQASCCPCPAQALRSSLLAVMHQPHRRCAYFTLPGPPQTLCCSMLVSIMVAPRSAAARLLQCHIGLPGDLHSRGQSGIIVDAANSVQCFSTSACWTLSTELSFC